MRSSEKFPATEAAVSLQSMHTLMSVMFSTTALARLKASLSMTPMPFTLTVDIPAADHHAFTFGCHFWVVKERQHLLLMRNVESMCECVLEHVALTMQLHVK